VKWIGGAPFGRRLAAPTPVSARNGSPPAGFEPVQLLELELAGLRCRPVGRRPGARAHRSARVLVRLHGTPLGVVTVDGRDSPVAPETMAVLARRQLAPAIDAHLAADGPAAASPSAPSAGPTELPHCVRERLELAARAPFASVVVGTRERPESLAATLDDLLVLEYPRFEIIVVDNASTTGRTRELLERRYADRPNVRYVREPLPGLAVAHNRGLDEARGEIVAFTDDDVVVDPLWLIELVRGFELADDVACVTGLILPAELETPAQLWLEDWVRLDKGYAPRLFDLGQNRPQGKLFPYAAGTFGSGANMAFRADALRALGGFDPATGTGSRARGGDDLSAFFSVLAAGHTLAYQPTAIVRHAHRPDAASLRRLMFDYGAGLGAFLTKIVVDRPSLLPDIAWRIPFGAAHALRSRPRGRSADADGLAGLAARERLGMLAGPPGYLTERHRRRALYTARRPGPRASGPEGHGRPASLPRGGRDDRGRT
jgi:glycosyltransferase involved in cell wall biosynthesis